MRIYIDKCGVNFNKSAAIIEKALTFTEKKSFDSEAVLKQLTKAEMALTGLVIAVYRLSEDGGKRKVGMDIKNSHFEKDPEGNWILKPGRRRRIPATSKRSKK